MQLNYLKRYLNSMTATSPKIRISCDDGCESDLRLAALAKKYDVECIFYWPVEHRSLAFDKGYKPLILLDQLRIANEFEIGAHTVTHRHLTRMSQEEAEIEILDSKVILEYMFEKEITKFCPPRGYINEPLTEYVMKHFDSQRLTRGLGLVHIHPNSGANGNIHWRAAVDETTEELWCHSWELDKYGLWDELEEFLEEQV